MVLVVFINAHGQQEVLCCLVAAGVKALLHFCSTTQTKVLLLLWMILWAVREYFYASSSNLNQNLCCILPLLKRLFMLDYINRWWTNLLPFWFVKAFFSDPLWVTYKSHRGEGQVLWCMCKNNFYNSFICCISLTENQNGNDRPGKPQ